MTKPAVPPVVPPRRPPLPPMEALYLRALVHWYRHRKKPPTIAQFRALLKASGRPSDVGYEAKVSAEWPSVGAVRRGLMSLMQKGYVRRNKGKFEVIR